MTEHREELGDATVDGTAQQTVTVLNVPNCAASGAKVRGLRELPGQPEIPDLALALTTNQDCASADTPAEEVAAFNAGFATLTVVPAPPPTT